MNEYRTFEDARGLARSLRLKFKREWAQFAKSKRRPSDIPTTQAHFIGQRVGLGSLARNRDNSATAKKISAFREARAFARSLPVRSNSEWLAFIKSGRLPRDIPVALNRIYAK
jgi:hypothetical protein